MKRLTVLMLLTLVACGGVTDPAAACTAYTQGSDPGQELNDWYVELVDMAPEGDVKDALFGVVPYVVDSDFDSPEADAAWARLAEACAAVGVDIGE